METTQVVIIGGGATGAGILWDLSLRGIAAVLLEQGDFANGATGRCHGLLHSGGRYVVRDAKTARECADENRIIKKIAPHCVEDTGGLFVQCGQDDPAFFEQWWRAAAEAGLKTSRLSGDEARSLEPSISSEVLGAFTSEDAHVDVFRLTLGNLEAALRHGARFHTYSQVTSIDVADSRVRGVHYRDLRTGEQQEIRCEMIINAAGGWAQAVAAMAGISVQIYCDKGALLVINHRLSKRVINRCRKPGDADILVPAGPVSILGTSSMRVPLSSGLSVSNDEIEHLLNTGNEMIPGLASARILRVFCGVRPLYVPDLGAKAGREMSRSFALLDHEVHDGVAGFISIVGGKLTTYRLMASAVCDCVCSKFGLTTECTTDRVPLRPSDDASISRSIDQLLPHPVAEKMLNRLGPAAAGVAKAIEAHPELAEIVCECEMVTRAELEYVLGESTPLPATTIADVGRRTRLGFGPCQGTFCGYRAMLTGYQTRRWSANQAAAQFDTYLEERWKGQASIHQGKQVEQLGRCHSLYDIDTTSSRRPGAKSED
jgi:glycerol-3-phosphate dehydrogenase